MNLCFRSFYLRMLTSRHVESWKNMVPQDYAAKVIVDGSTPIETGPPAISLPDSNVLLQHDPCQRSEFRNEESIPARNLGAVESTSPNEVRDNRHQVKSAYPSEVSPSRRRLAELENTTRRNVRTTYYYRDWVAGMSSIPDRGSVVGCQRD